MPSGCIEWTGSINCQTGYGMFKVYVDGARKTLIASRVAWERANGPIPAGLHVLHSCDNPPCCNPVHLSVGTRFDNLGDAKRKGRTVRGERSGRSKLREEQAREILKIVRAADRPTDRAVADRYGVHMETVRLIRVGVNWAWLDHHASAI